MNYYLIKKIASWLMVVALIVFLVFLGFTEMGRDMTDQSLEKVSSTYNTVKDYIKEKATEIVKERKDIVEEEVERERATIEEMIVNAGRSVFSRIGDLIFSIPFLSRE